MIIKELPYKTPIRTSQNCIALYDSKQTFFIWDKSTLAKICTHDFLKEFVNVENFGHGFVFNLPKKKEGYLFEEGNSEIQRIETDYSLYQMLKDGNSIGISKKDYSYALLDSKFDCIRSFDKLKNIYTLTCDQGFVDYTTQAGEKNYLRLRDPYTNETLYQYDFDNQGSHHEYKSPYLLLRVKGKGEWLIYCFNLEKKELVWDMKFKGLFNCLIDQKAERVIFCSNYKYQEVKLDRFEIINEFILERERKPMFPEVMRFLSTEGIFFYCNQRENKIGKVNRQSGIVEWEQNYLPNKCQSLNIYYWEEVMEGAYLIHVHDNEFPRLILMKE